jgi:hypothetical protein
VFNVFVDTGRIAATAMVWIGSSEFVDQLAADSFQRKIVERLTEHTLSVRILKVVQPHIEHLMVSAPAQPALQDNVRGRRWSQT